MDYSKAQLVNEALTLLYKVATALALLSMIWGSLLVMTAQGNIRQVKFGKYIFKKAIVGLIMVFLSVFLVKTIAVNILGIPGFR